jgi:Cytochrome c7 and related cytochrome c
MSDGAPMNSRILSILLTTGLLFSTLYLVTRAGGVHLPGNQQDYEPAQPIAYSHRLHAGELRMQCMYCHFSAEKSRHAGIPPAAVCMNCHGLVTASFGVVRAEEELAAKEGRKPRTVVSPELKKIYDALGLDDNRKPDPARALTPIAWTRVYKLPDFVYFDHRAHVNAGVVCQTCHGPVETMERMRQVPDLSMGWCVNCHRQVTRNGVDGKKVFASIDCSTCHY